MSGYRSLHRENVVHTSIWDLATSPWLSTASNTATNKRWRIWAACADGIVTGYVVNEVSLEEKQDSLNASALRLECTHLLVGSTNQTPSPPSAALGCSQVSVTRNYEGADDVDGDLVVISLDMGGKLRIWSFSGSLDDKEHSGEGPRQVKAKVEFRIENATGTTACLCPPRVWGVGEVVVAVGCLDGSTKILATGLATPKATKDPAAAGTELDSWGSRGSAIPMSLNWHPHRRILAVGRQDGIVDLLSSDKKLQHRVTIHKSPVRALTFTDDGHLLVAGSDEGLLCIWDVSRHSPVLVHHVLHAHQGWILNATALSDSRRFVTAGMDRKIHVWNVQQLYQPTHTFQTDHDVYSIHRGPSNAPRFVTGSEDGWLQVYSIES